MRKRIINNRVFSRWQILFLVICPSFILFSGCSSGTSGNGEKTVVFKNASVIDAVNGQRNMQNIIVKGNRIIEAGAATEVMVPPDADIIDCSGKFMIPGLWDAHAHLTNDDAMMPDLFPLLIANGILYIRDTGATLESILPLRENAEEARRLKGMAPQIYITGPHIDGLNLSWKSSVGAGTISQVQSILKTLMDVKVNELKVYDLIPRDVALEVFSFARNNNIPLSAHVPLAMDVVEASNAGLKSMEHMYNLEMSCSSDWDSLLTERRRMIDENPDMSGQLLRESIYRAQRLHSFKTQDEERRSTVLETLAENGTRLVPTLAIIAQDAHRMFARNEWTETFRYLPEPIKTRWKEEAVRRTQQTPTEEGLAHSAWAYDMVKIASETGIDIMAGTDMPLSLLTPGFSLHEELILLTDAGLTPLQAIESATLKPAQYFGIENQQGSIAAGMMADLILLDANPLDDIRNTLKINAVMANGHLHKREVLDAILLQLENPKEKNSEN